MVISSYEIENDKEFERAIQTAIKQVGDLSVAFTLIAKDWRKSNMAQFSLQSSGLYPPLSALYAARKRKRFGNVPILVATGRLRDSVTLRGNSDTIQIISKTGLILGTRTFYGIYHQSDAPRRKIPLRKFLFIGPEAPSSSPYDIRVGRLQRWLGYIEEEVKRKLNQ